MARRVGVFWMNESKNKETKGMPYMAGYINLGVLGSKKVAIFLNTKKEKPEEPDYHMIPSQEKLPVEPKDDDPKPNFPM